MSTGLRKQDRKCGRAGPGPIWRVRAAPCDDGRRTVLRAMRHSAARTAVTRWADGCCAGITGRSRSRAAARSRCARHRRLAKPEGWSPNGPSARAHVGGGENPGASASHDVTVPTAGEMRPRLSGSEVRQQLVKHVRRGCEQSAVRWEQIIPVRSFRASQPVPVGPNVRHLEGHLSTPRWRCLRASS
jgi:hypothetical protein